MKLLTDQDVYALTVRFLRSLGHDTVTAAELELDRASDLEILRRAERGQRIVITRDRDFGNRASRHYRACQLYARSSARSTVPVSS